MAVYVDPIMAWTKQPNWKWDHVVHMYADTEDELHRFAKKIGLKREWCSDYTQPNSPLLHYDINKNRRKKAVEAGAVEVGFFHKRNYMRDR